MDFAAICTCASTIPRAVSQADSGWTRPPSGAGLRTIGVR